MASDGPNIVNLWEVFARKASTETDPEKLKEILNDLFRALEQREKALASFRPNSTGHLDVGDGG